MNHSQTSWSEYLKSELPKIAAFVAPYGIILSDDQPHTKGERFLMQALTTTSGQKLILLGTETRTGKKVVIKATHELAGRQEIAHERTCRTLLHKVDFSYDTFHSPNEIIFLEKKGYTIFVTEFIEQGSSFLARPFEEQFSFALKALKVQERTRATTAKHLAQIKRVFGSRNSDDYLRMFDAFLITSKVKLGVPEVTKTLEQAFERLSANKERITQYGNFLTHTDFVPHNFRISGDTLYLLDFSSLRFGNKHEGWARFLNFMTLYNPALEELLISYIAQNRSAEERESLQLMRLFRLGEIIAYYTNTLEKSEDNLRALNQARIHFWSEVLKAELQNTRVSEEIVTTYKNTRDELRSDEEKMRQVGLH